MNNTVGVLYLAIYSLGYGVSATLVGVVMFLPRLWDMISDPIMGNLSDNFRSRWGRRRPFLPIGGLLGGVFFFLMWLPDPGWGESAKLGYFLFNLLLFYTAYTLFAIPWNSLGLELSDDYADRSSVQGYRIFCAMLVTFFYTFSYKFCFDFTPQIGSRIAELEASFTEDSSTSVWAMIDLGGGWIYHKLLVLLQPVVEVFFAGYFKIFPDRVHLENVELNGVAFVGAFFGVLICLFATIPALFLKERSLKNLQPDKTPLWEALSVVLRDRNLMSIGAAIFGIFLGFVSTQALTLYINTYYVFAAIPLEEAKAASGVMGGKVGIVYTIAGLSSVPVIGFLTKRLGKRAVMTIGLSTVAFGCILSYFLFDPAAPAKQLLLPIFFASGLNCVWINANSLVADICDLDELNTGKRREGIYGATLAWISKLGLAVALLLSGLVVDVTGIDPTLGQNQNADTITRVRLAYMLIPLGCLLISILIVSRFQLDEKTSRRVRAELDAVKKKDPTHG